MTFILIDKGDETRDLQLANRVWYCVLENLQREGVFDAARIELMSFHGCPGLEQAEAHHMAQGIRDRLLPKLADDPLLFTDGRVGAAKAPDVGYSLETPYDYVSHISRDTLEKLAALAETSEGLRIS